MARRTASLVAILAIVVVSLAASCGEDNGPRTGTDPDRPAAPAGVADLVLTADVAVMESFPVQLRGTLTVQNPTDEAVTFDVGGCPVFLRAYRTAGGGPVWDQASATACTMILRTVTLAPGASEVFQTPTASAGDILGDALPDGTYRVVIYLALAPGGEREAAAGDVQLAIPR